MPRRERPQSRREVLRAIAPTGRRAEMPSNLRFEVQDVTPHMAQVWLEGKTPNRNVSQERVDRFRRDMEAGAWHLNGETVIFDEEGNLMDGQHRLWAVFLSGKTVRLACVFGAKKASMETYDTGFARTFGDALKIRGKDNQTIVAAACRWWHWYDYSGTGTTTNAGVNNPTHYELSQALARHPSIEQAAVLVNRYKKAKALISPGILAFILTGAIDRNAAKAEAFLEHLAKGLGFEETDPVYHLHQKALANKGAKKVKLRPMVLCAYTMKAWNAYFKGRPMRWLKWQNDDPTRPEAFPRFED